MDKLARGKQVFEIEIAALQKTMQSMDDIFVQILDLIMACTGRVIVTGMGKSGHIAKKMAATFASLGTPSFYLHAGEALHGDLGMITAEDLVLILSHSGESDEIIRILPGIKLIGAKIVALSAREDSTLAKAADVAQIFPEFPEACHLDLAPTSSTTVALCYGDALAVTASALRGFEDVDFGKFHPAGALGKRLIYRVDDLMATGAEDATVGLDAPLKDVIVELSQKSLGMVSVLDADGTLRGVITDGDLRRVLERGQDIYSLYARDIMTASPVVVDSGRLAVEALNIMKERQIFVLPVVCGQKAIGTIKMTSLVSGGL